MHIESVKSRDLIWKRERHSLIHMHMTDFHLFKFRGYIIYTLILSIYITILLIS